MGRTIDVNDLIDTQGIADLFGVGRPQVHKWRIRGIGFPEPLETRLTSVLVWSWTDVKRWGIATGRLDEEGHPRTRDD